jgi:hypothetical protein
MPVRQVQGLGRRAEHKPEQRRHLMRDHTMQGVTVVRKNTYWPMFSFPLDQGATGTCVGFGTKHWELSAPIIQTTRMGPPTGFDFYEAATTRDAWHNGRPDLTHQDGTSVNAAMLALRDVFGYIDHFDWAFNVDDIIDFLCTHGPVILGVNWYSSMFTTDEEGILAITTGAKIEGGHCLCANQADIKRGLIGGPNSWGRPADFGKLNVRTGLRDGRWYMPLELIDRLVAREEGEAAASNEIRKVAS